MKPWDKQKKNIKKNKKTISPTKTKTLKEEKVPEWFNKEIEKEHASKEEQEEMQNLLSKYQ